MTFEWRTQESRRCDLDVSGVGVSYNRDMLGNLVNLAIAVASLFFRSHFVVRGDSMEPALRDGDLVHSVPRALLVRGLRRGSIVVADTRWGLDRIVIKRVAALPGEWVDVASDGAVFVGVPRSIRRVLPGVSVVRGCSVGPLSSGYAGMMSIFWLATIRCKVRTADASGRWGRQI